MVHSVENNRQVNGKKTKTTIYLICNRNPYDKNLIGLYILTPKRLHPSVSLPTECIVKYSHDLNLPRSKLKVGTLQLLQLAYSNCILQLLQELLHVPHFGTLTLSLTF